MMCSYEIDIGVVGKTVSPLAIGALGFESSEHAARMLDGFLELGGRVIDTAWIYRDGAADQRVGDWLEASGVRAEVTLIGKGAHSPLCDPGTIEWQLDQSLERLHTDHLDVYLLHRDNPSVPVGEFVEALDREVRTGRIGRWGGSNWSRARLDEARDYARAEARVGPSLLSNNFSLARMVEPVWEGCISASDHEWRDWLGSNTMPLLSWSSQARGFFTHRGDPKRRSDAEIVRCWFDDDNLRRRARAEEMGRRLGKSANQVALAFCLAQPFPILPIIGPVTLDELADSFGALEIELDAAALDWLENG